MTKRKEKEPLFYIQQPTFQFPTIKMQETYSSKKAESQKNAQKKELIEPSPKLDDREGEFTSTKHQKEMQGEKGYKAEPLQREKVQKAIEEYETGRRKNEETASFGFRTERKSSFQRVKSFKEMSIKERLTYLIEFPKQLPPVPCIFIANGNTFKGFLIDQTNEMIDIKQLNGDALKIAISELEDIKMIGLRR